VAFVGAAFGMNILVTGGAGYIGSVLTPALLAAGHTVTVVDNLLFSQTTLLDCCRYDTFAVVNGDARDERIMRELAAKADAVIPLAALVGAPLCDVDPVAATATNRDAVRMLCRLLSPNQQVILPTTNSGYGIGESGKHCTEETPLRPVSHYGVTKVEAEQAVLERERSVSLRLATVFGLSPRIRLDLLVNDFVYRAVRDRFVVVFEGHFKRNYIHIRDVVRAFLHVLDRFDQMQGRPYNVGLDEANLSKLELCAEIKKQVPEFVYLEAAIGKDPDKRDYIVSNARIKATGFEPQWTLAAGIAELIKGCRLLPPPPGRNR
jgi:nucleoside-diphosphate-sugar epimerase